MPVTHGPPLGLFGVGKGQTKPAPVRTIKREVPGCPPPPIVGKVTHHSIELCWDDFLTRENESCKKGDGRVKVTMQEQNKQKEWIQVYTGYAKTYVIQDLEPWSESQFRIRFTNEVGSGEWSPSIVVSTTKEPINGEHIHKAVMRQDASMLESLIETGDIPVDCPDKYGFTPLMQAAQKGFIEMIEVLISHRADVNFQNDAGKTSLMLAAYARQTLSVKELVHHGAKFEIQDRGGSTALHWAMDGKNIELIEWMLDNGGDIDSTDFNGWTPLQRVAAVGGDKECASTLLRHGADVNKTDKDGKSALMIAVVNGHVRLVELLLENGADIEIKSEFGKTAYEMALSMERRGVIKCLEQHMDKKGIKYY